MNELQQFIHTTQNSRELKRALAIQNTLAGRSWADVARELGVKESFIGKWRWRYKREGIACLQLGHKGSTGYLTATDKAAAIQWIKTQKSWNLRDVQRHLDQTYGVRYKSLQSYYALLKSARISWKKSQHRHPKADPDKVSAKRDHIKKKTIEEAPAIIVKRTVEVAIDECHLLWGDACGFVWGPRNERVELPIENIRTRQTYYGALNLLTGWTLLWEASAGNKENTVAFLTYLRQCFQGRRMIVLWDGAPYHRAHLVRDYVTRINGPKCPEAQRAIHLIQFAPYAPAQNPIEDVWLAGKRQVRKQWADLETFADVKTIFSRTVTRTQFLFEKLNWYGRAHLIAARRAHGFRWE